MPQHRVFSPRALGTKRKFFFDSDSAPVFFFRIRLDLCAQLQDPKLHKLVDFAHGNVKAMKESLHVFGVKREWLGPFAVEISSFEESERGVVK